MSKKASLVIMLIASFVIALLARPQFVTKVAAQDYTEIVGTLDGADFVVRFPENWNGMLVIICRGYDSTIPDPLSTVSLGSYMLEQGFAVAASNYGAAGFCIQKGVNSTYQLTQYIIDTYNVTGKVFLYGLSMGGAVALLLGEKYPNLYSGVLDLFGTKDLKDQYATKSRWANLTDEELTAELTALNMPIPQFFLPSLQALRTACVLNVVEFELETGGTPATQPKAYEDRSPTYHANITIPVITVHGTSDAIVPFYESIMYQTAVANAGRSNLYRLYNVTGGQHANPPVMAEVPARFDELVSWVDAITPPTVTILNPTNTTYHEDPQLQFLVDKPVTWMGYSLDGQNNVTITENTINLTRLSNGPHNLTVYANDTDGNTGASEIIIFTIVKPLPVISVLSPENKTYNVAEIMLNFTVNDEVTEITYCLDGQENVTISGNTTLTGLTNGNHNVTLYATDTSGNTGTSETIYFTIEVASTTWITAVIVIIAIIAIAAVILLYLTKTRKQKKSTTNT